MPALNMKRTICAGLALARLACAGNATEDKNAGIDPTAPAAYFVHAGYVAAVEVVKETGDVWVHMNGPSLHSWIGVGFGQDMSNSRMLIAYISGNNHNLTNSCRLSNGHSEPVYDPDCIIEPIQNDTYGPFANTLSPGGALVQHILCKNCSCWKGGCLDLENEQQPFIYALGPNTTLRSSDPAADLRLHTDYGGFTLNMTVATQVSGTYGRVPAPQDPALSSGGSFWGFANYFSSTPYGIGTIEDWSPVAHAVFMCMAFMLIFPLGAISLRLVRRVTFHATAQVIGLGFTIIGLGFGIYASKLYNKSKSFTSVHQIIGLLVFAALFIQIGLGLSHHLLFMRSGTPTVMGKIHRFLGVGIMVLALVNGGIGFNFAQNSFTAYTIVVILMAVILGALTGLVWLYNRRHVYRPEKEGSATPSLYRDNPNKDEYELEQRASFATMGHVNTPRTPHFAAQDLEDDPENYREHLARTNAIANQNLGGGAESLYAGTPASERKNPYQTKWEAVPIPEPHQ